MAFCVSWVLPGKRTERESLEAGAAAQVTMTDGRNRLR